MIEKRINGEYLIRVFSKVYLMDRQKKQKTKIWQGATPTIIKLSGDMYLLHNDPNIQVLELSNNKTEFDIKFLNLN